MSKTAVNTVSMRWDPLKYRGISVTLKYYLTILPCIDYHQLYFMYLKVKMKNNEYGGLAEWSKAID